MRGTVLVAIAMVSCGGMERPSVDPVEIGVAERSAIPRAQAAPERAPMTSERWRVLSVRARDEWGFMREGGLMALALLQGAELELRGSSVIVTMQGAPFETGTLVQDGAAVRLTFDGDTSFGLAGELGPEVAGQRSLENMWVTFTLERAVVPDARVKLCAGAGKGTLKSPTALTRRAACEAQETELLPTGAAVSPTP